MCTHLFKRGSRYYIRRRIPTDLIEHYGRKEIVRALGTSDRREAVRLCRLEGVHIDQQFAEARSRIEAAGASTPEVASITPVSPPSITPAEATARTRAAEDAERDRAEEHEYYYRYVKDEGVEEAEAEAFEESVARQVAVMQEAQRRVHGATIAEGRASAVAQKANANTGRTVSLASVVDSWTKERKPQVRTIGIANKVASRFLQHCGPLSVESITRQQVIAFKDALLASGQTPVNTDKQLTMLGTLLSFAVNQAIISSNPARGVKVGERRNAKAVRLPFDLPALRLIFSSQIYTEGSRPEGGAGEAAYWLPLLALYTGARLEELAQLHPADVQPAPYTDANGSKYSCHIIRISDEREGQELKTATSRRRVPIHADLIALGFLDYAASAKGTRLFPDLKPDVTGTESGNWSKWFGKYLRNVCKVTDKRMVFHSFRHLLKHTMREAAISEEVSDAITGHASASVGRRYGATLYPLAPLVDAMQRYRIYGLTLPPPWSVSSVPS